MWVAKAHEVSFYNELWCQSITDNYHKFSLAQLNFLISCMVCLRTSLRMQPTKQEWAHLTENWRLVLRINTLVTNTVQPFQHIFASLTYHLSSPFFKMAERNENWFTPKSQCGKMTLVLNIELYRYSCKWIIQLK